MAVYQVCQCGCDIDVSGASSGTEVRCPHCGRHLAPSPSEFNGSDPSTEDTGIFSAQSHSPKQDNTPYPAPPSSHGPVSTEASRASNYGVWHDQPTQITQVNPSGTKPDASEHEFDLADSGSEEFDGGATHVFDSNHALANEGEQDFELAIPRQPSTPDEEETKYASNPQLGSDSKDSSHHGSGSKITGLDLKERVMGTISRSSVPLNAAPTDTGGYGIHRILRTHQKGGMGRILIAYDQFLKRDIALKELHPEAAEDLSIVKRFIGEAEITAQLEHPGIVPIHMLGLDQKGSPYYTMKLIRGQTYQEAIKVYHRNPSKQELLNLIRRLVSICKTIAFAHSKGVIHRDLKPANIMLGEHGETLVMDWGLAKPLELLRSEETTFTSTAIDHRNGESRPELTMVGAVVGTPAFMSPEQASPEENKVGPLSDVFSLGTILYYLLAGQTAFSGRSTQEVLNKVRAASPPKPSEIKPNVPPGLEAICLKAMAKNPSDRYQNATALFDDLCRWLDGEPVLAQHETFLQRAVRWIDKHRIIAVSVPFFFILMVILVNAGIYIDRYGRDRKQQEMVHAALNRSVDLTDQPSVTFRGSPGIEVKRLPIANGENIVSCQVAIVPKSERGYLEIGAPLRSAWDLTMRNHLRMSIFEPPNKAETPLSNMFLRMGRGSSYFEFKPEPTWWTSRRIGSWYTFTIPLEGSAAWTRSEFGEPSMNEIEWIEIHFDVKLPETFQLDNIFFTGADH